MGLTIRELHLEGPTTQETAVSLTLQELHWFQPSRKLNAQPSRETYRFQPSRKPYWSNCHTMLDPARHIENLIIQTTQETVQVNFAGTSHPRTAMLQLSRNFTNQLSRRRYWSNHSGYYTGPASQGITYSGLNHPGTYRRPDSPKNCGDPRK
jgi:hypothetical protein